MPGHGRRTAAEMFEHRRRAQRVMVDRPTGDVILRLHETDIVRVTPNGDVILSTGGWATDKTLASMNDALELFGMWVDTTSRNIQAGSWTVTDSDSTVHNYHNTKTNYVITIPSKGGDDKQRAEWLAEAYEIPYTAPAAAPPAAAGPRRAAAPAAAASGPRVAAAPSAAAPSWGNGLAAPAPAPARPPGIGGSWANIAKSANPLLQASTGVFR